MAVSQYLQDFDSYGPELFMKLIIIFARNSV